LISGNDEMIVFWRGFSLGGTPQFRKTNVCLTTNLIIRGNDWKKDGLCTIEFARLCSKNCIADGLIPKAKEALTQNKKTTLSVVGTVLL
jgi:hypothetical protein